MPDLSETPRPRQVEPIHEPNTVEPGDVSSDHKMSVPDQSTIAKYVMRIELADSFESIAGGRGGYWEDRGYELYAGI